MRAGFALCVAMAIAIGMQSAAHAAMMFTLDSGSLTLTVDEYSESEGRLYRAADSVTVDIFGVVLMVDPGVDEMFSFQLTALPNVELELLPDTPSHGDGYEMIMLNSFDVSALGGALIANDSGYAFDGGVDVAAVFGASGPGGYYESVGVAPSMSDLGQGPVYGDLGYGESIRMAGVAVGSFDSPWNGNQLVVTGDFSFVAKAAPAAPVPEPSAPLLFAAGLLVATAAVRRHPPSALSVTPVRWRCQMTSGTR